MPGKRSSDAKPPRAAAPKSSKVRGVASTPKSTLDRILNNASKSSDKNPADLPAIGDIKIKKTGAKRSTPSSPETPPEKKRARLVAQLPTGKPISKPSKGEWIDPPAFEPPPGGENTKKIESNSSSSKDNATSSPKGRAITDNTKSPPTFVNHEIMDIHGDHHDTVKDPALSEDLSGEKPKISLSENNGSPPLTIRKGEPNLVLREHLEFLKDIPNESFNHDSLPAFIRSELSVLLSGNELLKDENAPETCNFLQRTHRLLAFIGVSRNTSIVDIALYEVADCSECIDNRRAMILHMLILCLDGFMLKHLRTEIKTKKDSPITS